VTHVIHEESPVAALTSLGDDVFVVRYGDRQQIEVHDAATFTLQRCLAVSGLGSWVYGLAVCPVNKCLYASDWDNSSVHRVELSDSNAVMKWSVAKLPAGLTVNRAQNLLVVSAGEHKLQKFTTCGTLLQNIQLQSDAAASWHAVDMANGHFLVCCRAPLHDVCMVDQKGVRVQSYGGQTGSQIMKMDNPVCLAVDKHGNILVADQGNNRLLVLDSSLSSAHEMSVSVRGGLERPYSLWYDQSRGRLYIGERPGRRVIVIDHLNDFTTSHVDNSLPPPYVSFISSTALDTDTGDPIGTVTESGLFDALTTCTWICPLGRISYLSLYRIIGFL